jgi:hypothetical protein
MSDQEQLEALISRSEEARLDFLRIDLELSKTFADLATTEMAIGELDAARRVLAKAKRGYATIQRMVLNLDDPHQQNEILQRLGELRVAIDTAHQQLGVRSRPQDPAW